MNLGEHFTTYWLQDGESIRAISVAFLSALGTFFVAWYATKGVKETIKNQNQATPPEMLKLEKILEISAKYKEMTGEIDSELTKEIDLAKRRTVLESKIKNFTSNYQVQKLLERVKIESQSTKELRFPDPMIFANKFSWFITSIFGAMILLLLLLIFVQVVEFFNAIKFWIDHKEYNIVGYIFSGVIVLALSITCIFLIVQFISFILGRKSLTEIEYDLILRNIIQHNTEYFFGETNKDKIVKENIVEARNRLRFEASKKFKEWSNRNLYLDSWFYGMGDEHIHPIATEFNSYKALPLGYMICYRKRYVAKFLPKGEGWVLVNSSEFENSELALKENLIRNNDFPALLSRLKYRFGNPTFSDSEFIVFSLNKLPGTRMNLRLDNRGLLSRDQWDKVKEKSREMEI